MQEKRHPKLSTAGKKELFSILDRLESAIVSPESLQSRHSNVSSRRLTPREREVLRLVARGKNNTQIAQELLISVNTVTRHMTNIFSKTGVSNRVQAAVYATRYGIER